MKAVSTMHYTDVNSPSMSMPENIICGNMQNLKHLSERSIRLLRFSAVVKEVRQKHYFRHNQGGSARQIACKLEKHKN